MASRLSALVLALLVCLPLARGEEASSFPPPVELTPTELLDLLQRVFSPLEEPEPPEAQALAETPPAPDTPAPPPEEALREDVPEGEERVAEPLAPVDFRERELPAPPAAAPALPVLPEAASAPADAEAVPRLRPGRQGYAFAHPRVLAQQTLFGLSHGISLLGRACLLLPEGVAAQAAYELWEMANREVIERAEYELARYYFTPPAKAVSRLQLIQALGLRTELGLATDSPELAAACATLSQALEKPRYDLKAQWQLKGDVERLRRATQTRELVAQCRLQAVTEDEPPRLDAALAAWEAENQEAEVQAQERLLSDLSVLPPMERQDPRLEPRVALESWQKDLRRSISRLVTYGGAEVCPDLARTLAGPDHDLAHAFDLE